MIQFLIESSYHCGKPDPKKKWAHFNKSHILFPPFYYMGKRDAIICSILTSFLIISFAPLAFGEHDGLIHDVAYLPEALAGLSFIAAGLLYSSLGYFRKVLRALSGEQVTFNFGKMGRSVLLGVILGIAAFIWTGIEGDIITVTTAKEFGVQVGLNSAAIMIVHKLLLGRKESSEDVSEMPKA